MWHSPKDIQGRGTGPVTKLTILQNKCLRSIIGAYKATNIKVLQPESGVLPLDIYLDQAVLRSRDAPRCSKVIRPAKAKISYEENCVGQGEENAGQEPLQCQIKTNGPNTA